MNKYGKFAILITVIVGSLVWLATAGIKGSQTYYKTITELRQMGGDAHSRHIRVGGDIQSNSIVHDGQVTRFNLVQDKQILAVAYEGRDPLPDTFRDGAQALAGGQLGPDGIFHAQEVQAKCASKYAPAPGQAPEQLQKQMTPGQASPSYTNKSL